MICRLRRLTRQPDRGSSSLELIIIVPSFLLILGVLIFAGRVAIARQTVHAAAADAARAASIARTAGTAGGDARSAANATLTSRNLDCSSTTVSVNTAGFGTVVGTPATVSATVSCTVHLSDLAIPGVPGSRTLTATVQSPLDTFRERASGFMNFEGLSSRSRGR
jgi:Flp pilus assembly protein TadG